MSIFADDTKSFSEPNISLQFTLENIYKWLKTRKLYLNPNKHKILTINKNKLCPIDLFINNTKIPTVKVFKDLGIYISENLKLNVHIYYLYKVVQISSYQI